MTSRLDLRLAEEVLPRSFVGRLGSCGAGASAERNGVVVSKVFCFFCVFTGGYKLQSAELEAKVREGERV